MLCRKRKANFTEQELEVLIANVQARKEILFTKRNTTASHQAKQHAWECIARKINSADTVGGEHRTVNDVRRKWVCLLSETKKAELKRRRMEASGLELPASTSGGNSALGGSGYYSPMIAENILNICKSMDNVDDEPSAGRPSIRIEDANDLSMSPASENTGAGFVSGVSLIGHNLTNNSNTNNSNNDNNDNSNNNDTDNDNDVGFLQVTSVYSQNEQVEGVEINLNDSPAISRQTANIRTNSGGSVGNNRRTSDATTAPLHPMSDLNNRNVMHMPKINSDIGIVRITPNINSNVYADSTVYLNEAGASDMTVQCATAMSLRQNRHAQAVNNDQGRNRAETGGLISDDDGVAEIAPSIEHIEWNVGHPYANATYINSSGSDQDRRATPDHQPYHVTISGAESDGDPEVRPRRRKYYKTDEDYTEKLYWVEKRRLEIEERRLAIEEERLAIERERLERERQNAKRNQQTTCVSLRPSQSTSYSEMQRISSPIFRSEIQTPKTEDTDEREPSSTKVPITLIGTNGTTHSEEMKMTSVSVDLAGPTGTVSDDDGVGISY